MNTASILHHLLAIATVLLAPPFTPAATSGDTTAAPSSPVPGGCADSVISFSPCLPYISAPPNDLSYEPSSQCCDIFNGAFDSDEAECLCYLVRQNSLLGFPLNVTKMLLLSDLCFVKNSSQTNSTKNSLDSICSGSPTLPPLIAMPKKPPSDNNARRAPPPPKPTLHHPPPIPVTKPAPANNASTRNTTKPSTPVQSNNLELTNVACILCFLFEFVYFIIGQI